jgi:hypothetical protein
MARESISGEGAGSGVPSFPEELARAMQAVAEQERERIAAVLADEAAEHVEKASTRAAAETGELRRLAEEDVDRIQAWFADETERLRREADRRTDERRNELGACLAQHDSIMATEIDSVWAAVRDYRSILDQFFDELRGATDAVDIARRAGSLPALPDLDHVREDARASAMAKLANGSADVTDEPVADEPGRTVEVDAVGDEWADAGPGLGVMDPEAFGRRQDLPEAPEEVDAEAEAESATAPPADPELVAVGPAVEGAVTESIDRSSRAVRLLRSIAHWTILTEHVDRDREAENP